MSKRKTFGISSSLSRGFTETVSIAENHEGLFRNTVIPLSRLEMDPENPRNLQLTVADVQAALAGTQPFSEQKKVELEKIRGLAATIEQEGLLQPIVVYKDHEDYRVVAGHRRILACTLLGKNEIEARVFHEKPSRLDLKLVQWAENTAREDLTLAERLHNILEIVREYDLVHGSAKLSIAMLMKLTGLSSSQAGAYVALVKAPEDVLAAVRAQQIQSLDKAALLAGASPVELRKKAIAVCAQGYTLKQLRTFIMTHKQERRAGASKSGKKPALIPLGSTCKLSVLKMLVQGALLQPQLRRHQHRFHGLNWNDRMAVTRAFRQLITLLETEVEMETETAAEVLEV